MLKTPYKFILFALTLTMLSFTSYTQEVWNWQKCIDYALKNNLQLKQSELNIQLGESTLKQQKLNFSPTINGSSNYDLKIGNNYDFFANTYTKAIVHYQDYGINASQFLMD